MSSSSSPAPSSLSCTRLTVCTVAAVILQVIGLSLFVLGFFPVKPALSGSSGPESLYPPVSWSDSVIKDHNVMNLLPEQLKQLYQELYLFPPPYDRLIMMVVDGLPAEFVLGRDGQPPPKDFLEAMSYTQSLLAGGNAVAFHAKAAPPTVTMPRLKAMLSGAIGGFLDVALNFNTQALLDDNLIGQFYNIGWKMVMLGDETWLKLFPGLFTRHDGVSSFYVKDTVEVDYNISRHLTDELNRTDWNSLILHYLGLDHVGHIGGRSSVLMGPKLKEMDEVIKMIHLSSKQSQENDRARTLLMVVSDHGMTENGNHGGSSYEESDSLVLLVGLQPRPYHHLSEAHRTIDQVDIAPTLALLFGVPIPKNNVGILISEAFDSLTDEQKLRVFELNSWQLFRLLEAQLPGLFCESSLSSLEAQRITMRNCNGTDKETMCCLFVKAAALQKVWISRRVSGFDSKEEYSQAVLAHHDFLRAASQWLSHRATYKPAGLLACGIAAMGLSCFIILKLLISLHQEVQSCRKHLLFDMKSLKSWHLDESFILAILVSLILSMGSSSMVEEEHYMWYFLTSTFHLVLLRKTSMSLASGTARRNFIQVFCVVLILISGRIMSGWHRGGVNWTHLPDISKWLEQSGTDYVKSTQLVSWVIIMSLSLCSLSFLRSKSYFVVVIGFSFLVPGLLVLQYIIKFQDTSFSASGYGATSMAQKIYSTLGILTIGTVFVIPWFMPVSHPTISSDHRTVVSNNIRAESRRMFFLVGFQDCLYLVGLAYTLFWCLLQLVLQQPINTMPVSMLLVQILGTMCYYSSNGILHLQHWVKVAALYYLGMAGHFALGNTNTLATIDVAGAFIGMSSHSMLLSGILMFIITYASPMLAFLSMVMFMSITDTVSFRSLYDAEDIGHLLKTSVSFPCLVPLGLNSVLLLAYTIVLLLMRNHLFVWSVFSPKYVYVCAATACVYVGVSVVSLTAFYAVFVFALRSKRLHPSVRD